MTSLHPIRQAPAEDLRNALQIVEMYGDPMVQAPGFPDHALFADIARLIRHALEGLSEPNEASLKVSREILRAALGSAFELLPESGERWVRDTVAVIVRAQITGVSPETL